MLNGLRVFSGLVLLFLGVMQTRVIWRGLWGLSLARRCRWAGYLLAACLIVAGLALSVAPLPWVVLCSLPAVVAAMAILLLLSSWINRDVRPPDVRSPGAGEPWTCEQTTFLDGQAQTPALMLKPVQPNGGCVCWVHGSGDGKARFKWTLVRALTRRGFAVFTFDLPGHDEHPGRFSLPEALTAVPAALSYLAQRPDLDAERIGLMGVSLGGALVIRELARAGEGGSGVSMPKAVCLLETPCAVRLGPWLRVLEPLGMATLQALEVFRDASAANLLRLYRTHPRARWAEGVEWAFDDLSPARYVAEMPSLPLLIVSGGRDAIARRWHGERLYERAQEPKAWHVVRPASHFTLIFLPETERLVGEWFSRSL